jgi:hypothetical protein
MFDDPFPSGGLHVSRNLYRDWLDGRRFLAATAQIHG